MLLADFIESNLESILAEWERFARGIWPGTATDPATLRDHAGDVLRATIADMRSAQTPAEQSAKSTGGGAPGVESGDIDAASHLHGADRAAWGFDLSEVVSEYRALRASVLRLWQESLPVAHNSDIKDLTRFNESIDQSLTEAVSSYAAHHRKCQDELSKAEAARMGAENANRAKDAFLATLSHELRTPLNAIVGWLNILRDEGCTHDDLQEGLDVIERNTQSQVRLIEDILDVSRIVSGKVRLERQECDLAQVIGAGVDAVRPAAEVRGVRLEVNIDRSTRPVSCDAGRIQQAVGNLLSNAVKFTPRGGLVSVALAPEGARVCVRVRDTGQGIGADFLPHVFDRFRQGDDGTRRKSGGLGLGLSIVKHLVELHGGSVLAESAGEGHGSTFTILLPAGKAPDGSEQPNDAGAERTLRPEATAVRLDGLRVLLVDDEADGLRVVTKLLESVGAIVVGARSARAALDALAAGRPDVLISDIGMPGEDGYDLIREVRRRGHLPKDLPAVALTAFVQREDRRQALLAGFQTHVPKPINAHDLTVALATLTGRAGVPAP